jgi:hypothetical protein
VAEQPCGLTDACFVSVAAGRSGSAPSAAAGQYASLVYYVARA